MTYDADKYQDIPYIAAIEDEHDYQRFPISYLHIVQIKGHYGENLFAIRVRFSTSKLGLMCEPTSDLDSLHGEIERMRLDLIIRHYANSPHTERFARMAQRRLVRERQLAGEAVAPPASESPKGP